MTLRAIRFRIRFSLRRSNSCPRAAIMAQTAAAQRVDELSHELPVLLPMHPRTRGRVQAAGASEDILRSPEPVRKAAQDGRREMEPGVRPADADRRPLPRPAPAPGPPRSGPRSGCPGAPGSPPRPPGPRGRRDGLAEELKAYVRDRLEPYKHPREVVFMDALPRTHLGKVDRGRLRRPGESA